MQVIVAQNSHPLMLITVSSGQVSTVELWTSAKTAPHVPSMLTNILENRYSHTHCLLYLDNLFLKIYLNSMV